jgi:hypothetical protein
LPLGGNDTARFTHHPDEYERLFALAEKVFAGWSDYRVKTASVGRQIPVFRLKPREK